jgi:hypothetical protein
MSTGTFTNDADTSRTGIAPTVTGNIFTPNVGPYGQRVMFLIDDGDMEDFDALPRGPSPETVRVTDLMSDSIFTIKRADCGAGCFCAAEVVS